MLNKKERAEHEQLLARIKGLQEINESYKDTIEKLRKKYYALEDQYNLLLESVTKIK
ncbi:hypothetical protein [Pectinatus frisingensis]|uniref:hypothetical protein n=1 Tax=Pectinatus frisingensis TaxID=865 RepID=UPI0018C7DE6F|nr:hypothetical protein [Pectinatus frisingensis]